MDIETISQYFNQYGVIAIFVVVLLEYMNLPGFPAGVIMPLTGIWAKGGGMNFFAAILLTLAAGVAGSWILYGIGRLGGKSLLGWYRRHFPKQKEALDKNLEILRRRGCVGVFFGKLIPMVRTLISIPAGALEMNFMKYTIASALGVLLWNMAFVGAGYLMGDVVFEFLGWV